MDNEARRYTVLGRGAASNHVGRFEAHARTVVDDGWDSAEDVLPVFRTETSFEVPRSLITYNRSPDLPFDRSINPYRGCEHGCVYCFARPSHAYLGLSPGLDFETRLVARPGAADVLRRELAQKSYKVAPIAVGTNTDPYQPVEKKHEIMRACLKVLADAGHPVARARSGGRCNADVRNPLTPHRCRCSVAAEVKMSNDDKEKPRTWVVEARAFTACRGCEEPGTCAIANDCRRGYPEAVRGMTVDMGDDAVLMSPLVVDWEPLT